MGQGEELASSRNCFEKTLFPVHTCFTSPSEMPLQPDHEVCRVWSVQSDQVTKAV